MFLAQLQQHLMNVQKHSCKQTDAKPLSSTYFRPAQQTETQQIDSGQYSSHSLYKNTLILKLKHNFPCVSIRIGHRN